MKWFILSMGICFGLVSYLNMVLFTIGHPFRFVTGVYAVGMGINCVLALYGAICWERNITGQER